jgi:hypothetical protein
MNRYYHDENPWAKWTIFEKYILLELHLYFPAVRGKAIDSIPQIKVFIYPELSYFHFF